MAKFHVPKGHKRSNVETTFMMIKAKFGDGLRSKTKRAQINEALCKGRCPKSATFLKSLALVQKVKKASPVNFPARRVETSND